MTLKVMVTGSSGLLGSAVSRILSSRHHVIRIANNNALPGMTRVDLESGGAEDTLNTLEWNAVVHCAAFRSPDYCETNPQRARALNTEAPGMIAGIARAHGARMIHISTDYVFDGNSPPYRETSSPSPVNLYGKTKLEAERLVTEIYPEALILRIPALYGDPPPPARSPMLDEAIETAVSENISYHDNKIVRYPTFADDVARIILFFLERRHESGIVHASAPEKATRYEWARAVTRIIGNNCDKIRILESDPRRIARRPVDSALSTDKLKSLGAPLPMGYNTVLPELKRIMNLAEKKRKETAL